MEPIKDQKMKGVIIYDDENRSQEKKEVNIVGSSKYEEELPDAAFCSDDYETTEDDDDDDSTDMDDAYSDMDELPSNQKGEYKILSVPEIVKCQEDDINNVSNVLSISRAEATILLLFCRWDVQNATDRWLSDAKETRAELGLPENISTALGSPSTKDMTCGKCSAPVPEFLCSDLFCGHKFCKTCWQDFIGKSLKETNLILRCPDQSCDASVNQDIISMVASEADQKNYSYLFLRSYLADATKGKWCPTPGCNHAVVLVPHSVTLKFTCKCLVTFCYRCLKEAHQPVSCAIFDSWRVESLKQSPNWHLACIRQCPKCHRSVEINAWHKRAECPPCKFHFCSTCSGPWLEHGRWVGDQFTHFCPEDKLKANSEIEKRRAQAAKELGKYQEYFKQWRNFQMEQENALMKVQSLQRVELKVLAEKQGLPLEEVSFVADAWLQVAECKRVFKWACVYDYYFFQLEETRRPFFNLLMKHGVFVLNQLGQCASELPKFLAADAPPTDQFAAFREKLCLKLRVTKNFFENLQIAIKNGYQDLESLRSDICSRESIERKAATKAGTHSGATESASETTDEGCPHCSFPTDHSTAICVMCYH
ncbi:hypothetical protein RND81_05G082800 [Saponaria officinalis]|uniref:RBR-type E3 ubiquitin transferase n=1 Tax=Saponaria officinalis TaxID=3572 RepID=A0AAW1KTM2_SAPOF